MQQRALTFAFTIGIVFTTASPVFAQEYQNSNFRFNNENWYTLPHPTVASFDRNSDGSFQGVTVDGRTFSQYTIMNPYDVHIERFEIDDHYHYIVDGVVANSLVEFSVLLALIHEDDIV